MMGHMPFIIQWQTLLHKLVLGTPRQRSTRSYQCLDMIALICVNRTTIQSGPQRPLGSSETNFILHVHCMLYW